MTGQTIAAYVTLKPEFSYDSEEALTKELVIQVRRNIGPFAAPKKIIIVSDLPKTSRARSCVVCCASAPRTTRTTWAI